MTPFSELRVGDVVEVCRVSFPGTTEWLPAIIVELRAHAIGARFMRPSPAGDYIAMTAGECGDEHA